jgi:GNAT superfamily N-acetyltransferase
MFDEIKHGSAVVTRRSLSLQPYQLDEVLKIAYHSCVIDGMCLGWVTREAFNGMHAQGRMVTCWNNGDCVGYVVWGVSAGTCRIFLTWVRRDARLILHGRALVDHVEAIARARGAVRIDLFCAQDLAANVFWRAIGFDQLGWRWGKAKKARRHWLWRRAVATHAGVPLGDESATPASPTRPILATTESPTAGATGKARPELARALVRLAPGSLVLASTLEAERTEGIWCNAD